MLPTFHTNNFKPWDPHHTKSFPPRKSLTSRTLRAPIPTTKLNKPPHKPRNDSLPSTLPSPKHRLPARPPAGICVHISTDTQPFTLNSQPPPRELPFREDTAGEGQSSPSISSDATLEEFFRLPGLQNNIPIDPVILADNTPWEEASGLHQPIQQCDGLMIPETICPSPEPPTLCDAPNHLRGSSEGPGSQSGNTRTSDYPRTQGHRQLYSSNHNSEADASRSNGSSENLHGEQSKDTAIGIGRTSSQTHSSSSLIANKGRFPHRPSFSFPVSTT
ncbi:hypothetical protein ASPBRDRAFT_675413 [Aspergillus brasiliensis CBS 101740]|uniref:Uncharacterized protein n=1 Tax=Aspergillus brasiliensis (strain CBS 101740 / IMI 381727 / IBT 21946) TaxID=767769 RepID=A0A1L9U186_ASPBC|nr:hypothetical protein ASPBRDRAFT_675413 [Aspergillus brasiliensis CBS 101740]